jgi:hypothetical protein
MVAYILRGNCVVVQIWTDTNLHLIKALIEILKKQKNAYKNNQVHNANRKEEKITQQFQNDFIRAPAQKKKITLVQIKGYRMVASHSLDNHGEIAVGVRRDESDVRPPLRKVSRAVTVRKVDPPGRCELGGVS